MTRGVTYRTIRGVCYRCIDIGCVDFDRAEYNRFIVENNLFITGYLDIERAVAHTPLHRRLPSWIPRGVLPQVSKEEWRRFSGGYMHKIEGE